MRRAEVDIGTVTLMPAWVPVLSWAVALGFAVIVLGFLIYEISWKSRRLSDDRAKLAALLQELRSTALAADRDRKA
jgi:hypothetical protein